MLFALDCAARTTMLQNLHALLFSFSSLRLYISLIGDTGDWPILDYRHWQWYVQR
jgi:hypothetical protein